MAQEVKLKDNPDDRVFLVPEERFQWLVDKLEKLNRIAKKLGTQPITMEVVGESAAPTGGSLPFVPGEKPYTGTVISMKHVKVHGEAPILNGWQFLGKIIHTEEGNIIKAVPGVHDIPPTYRNEAPKCDHCGYKRNRIDTFIVRNTQTGEMKQCGSNCLKDFIGHMSPEAYANLAEQFADLVDELDAMSDEMGEGGKGEKSRGTTFLTETFVWFSYLAIKQHGFMGRQKARDEMKISTVDNIYSMLLSKEGSKEYQERQKVIETSNPLDEEYAKNAIAWARSLKQPGNSEALSDYMYNLSVAVSLPTTDKRTSALVTSLIPAYQRMLDKSAPTKDSIGKVGDKVLVKGVIKNELPYQKYNLYEMVLDDGKIVKWFGETIGYTENSAVAIEGIIRSSRQEGETSITALADVKVIDEAIFEQMKKQKIQEGVMSKEGMPAYNTGDKIEVDISIISKKEGIQSIYGTSTLYKMKDKWDNTLVWFSSSQENFDVGEQLKIIGTVKGRQSYQGEEQISLTRVKALQRSIKPADQAKILSPEQQSALYKELDDMNNHFQTVGGYQQFSSKGNEFVKLLMNDFGMFHGLAERELEQSIGQEERDKYSYWMLPIIFPDQYFNFLKKNIDTLAKEQEPTALKILPVFEIKQQGYTTRAKELNNLWNINIQYDERKKRIEEALRWNETLQQKYKNVLNPLKTRKKRQALRYFNLVKL